MPTPILIALVIFIEGFLHYFPWRLVLRRDLPRPLAYALGTLAMMIPFTIWLIDQRQGDIAGMLWLVIGAGGASVMAWYGLDWVIDLVWSVREASQREKAALAGLWDALDVKK